jgi:hypothetical protein
MEGDTVTRFEPRAWFASHPQLYRLSLGMTVMAFVNALRRFASARGARARVLTALMVITMAVEVIGLIGLRRPRVA